MGPSQEQRKAAQLRKSNPQREKNPKTLADYQTDMADQLLLEKRHLSRGQKKRAEKKTKFVNQKYLEKKHEEHKIAEEKARKEQQQELKRLKNLCPKIKTMKAIKTWIWESRR